jgi:hypothetical protein
MKTLDLYIETINRITGEIQTSKDIGENKVIYDTFISRRNAYKAPSITSITINNTKILTITDQVINMVIAEIKDADIIQAHNMDYTMCCIMSDLVLRDKNINWGINQKILFNMPDNIANE